MNKGPTIINYVPEIQAEYDSYCTRERELRARRGSVNREIEHILKSIGPWIAEGGDWEPEMEKVQKLRAEAEALDLAVTYLGNKEQALKSMNTWIVSR